MQTDLAIVGWGGGAFAAAIAARNKDRSVVMIEQNTMGGTCVNTGCVPSKALLAAVDARHVALSADRFPGIRASADEVAFAELIADKAGLVAAMQAEKYVDLAAKYGWEILHGHATFTDGPAWEVTLTDGGSTRVEAQHYLIATGSAPWAPPIDGLDEVDYLTSTTAMELKALPESMLVIGGNYIGLGAKPALRPPRRPRHRGRGLANKAIAQHLHISEATVKTHLLHIFDKLGVNDRTAAVTLAL